MPYRRPPAVQARLDARRDQVLEAAVRLLSREGYAGCSVAAIAAEAGISTGSVYQSFSGKSELAAALFRALVAREVEAVAAAAERPGSAAQRVAAAVETFATRALQAPRRAFALLAEPVDPAVDSERLVFRRAFRDVFAQQIAAGVATGELPPQSPELTAAALVGAVAEALVGPLADGDARPDDVIPALITFTLRSLGGHDAADA
ncbi:MULTISPECIES: TetR/AcrR family transcriptional regulator [unclassified Streptomyces]|uniref:TetR/AcrR family transcriptional regulator n=1 Tax=unclassified Streptomyces TaxID=2593676 RepID=UPI000DC7AF78|nr:MULTISPECIES: TetR/AcrR family transcriptional regulator [unclassified Streptomyces]AWZ06928.1 TetR/AcrR family transcriptional regulator [Streptomyces sp. ICC4]AWZ13626.1 TetR/AcrR family transcriptional regulator [Streptomyces sp. ICC1]